MKKVIYILTIVVLLSGLLLAACAEETAPPAPSAPAQPTTPAQPATPPKPPEPDKHGGMLTVITNAGPLAFGLPTELGMSAPSIMAAIPSVEALIDYDNDGKPHGVLAESWKVDAANKTITFNLRKGVKFHDGTDVNANAVKWNLEQFISKKKSQAVDWLSIDIIDDYTIRLNLKVFKNTALTNLESSAGMMISPTAYDKNGEEWAKTNPIGTGAFKLKDFQRDSYVEYERFPDYWGKGKPYLDGLKFTIIADAVTARMAFEAGQGNVLTNQSGDATKELEQKGYKTESRAGAAMVLIPDSAHPDSPFADKKVREAVEYAIDRETLADRLGFGYWDPMNQPAAKHHFGYVKDIGRKYDPAKAKQLLAEAGYPNGFTTSIISASSFSQDPLTSMQGYLAEVGINAKLDIVSFAKWNEMCYNGWDNALLWVTQGATDTNYCAFLERYYAASATRYPVLAKPPEATRLIDEALQATEYEKQVELSQKAVKVLFDDATSINVYVGNATYILQKNVHDTAFYSLGGSGFRWEPENTWLEK